MTLQDFAGLVGVALGHNNANQTITIPLTLARDIKRVLGEVEKNDSALLRLFGGAIAAGECPDCRLAFFEEHFSEAPRLAVEAKHNVGVMRKFAGHLDQAIVRAQVKHAEESDLVGRFLADCVRTAKAGTVSRNAMYDAFAAWAKAKGLAPWKPRAFSLAMAQKGFVSVAAAPDGHRVYSNTALVNVPTLAPGFDGDARLGRYLDIANELPGLAPRHNDDRKITRLLCEAAKLEAELPSLPISIPITALHRVGQARADRLALLADDLRAVRRQRDYWRSIGVRSTDKEWVKLDGREADITSEIELIGGGAAAPAGTAKA